jgi:hypothetical protein
MILQHQKAALAAAVFATVGLFGSVAFADNPGPPTHILNSANGEVRGHIDFQESLLSKGYSSKVCSDFGVRAENAGETKTFGKSKKMSAKQSGGSVECSYTVKNLPPNTYAMVPKGHPKGFDSRCGTISPNPENATVPVKVGSGPIVSHVDFTYSLAPANACAAPAP